MGEIRIDRPLESSQLVEPPRSPAELHIDAVASHLVAVGPAHLTADELARTQQLAFDVLRMKLAGIDQTCGLLRGPLAALLCQRGHQLAGHA